MVYAAVEAIDSKSCLTAELLVKNYISRDYGKTCTSEKSSKQITPKEAQRILPTLLKYFTFV